MAYRFTDDDRNKDVVTADGKRIGTVRTVEEDRATVDRDDESLTDKVKDFLGWGDDDDEIRHDHVDRSDEERIHLRSH
ncbi:hypothetical protein [Haloarchaeobius sp. TZWWS8]|uniref:hypothetical protein n=1 Tax=Haloarchaeobius sp. TZWWS8 TaxID=3446121 RepID=UPI003EB77C56